MAQQLLNYIRDKMKLKLVGNYKIFYKSTTQEIKRELSVNDLYKYDFEYDSKTNTISYPDGDNIVLFIESKNRVLLCVNNYTVSVDYDSRVDIHSILETDDFIFNEKGEVLFI